MQRSAFSPFQASEVGKTLAGQHPDKEILFNTLSKMPPHEHRNFIRLWMLEGIPKAFDRAPIMFDVVREWLSEKIGISQRNISLIGSARIGYSLAPGKFGMNFTEHKSDIDLCAVCPETFQEMRTYFEEWKNMVSTKKLIAPSEKVADIWEANFKVCNGTLGRGFIDLNKIYSMRRFNRLVQINDALYRLTEKINITPELPKIRKASLRLYKDWPALINQNCLNLRLLIQKRIAERQLEEMRKTPL